MGVVLFVFIDLVVLVVGVVFSVVGVGSSSLAALETCPSSSLSEDPLGATKDGSARAEEPGHHSLPALHALHDQIHGHAVGQAGEEHHHEQGPGSGLD